EEMSAEKLRRCIEGHPVFISALRRFLDRPEKSITYLPGNHDIDLHFEAVRELFLEAVAPTREAKKKIRVITESDCYYLPDGIQVYHGHQFEAMNRFDMRRFTIPGSNGQPVINLPWGSIFVLRVLNPLKGQRPYVDRVYPFKLLILGGLFFDFRFTLK